MTFFPNQFTLTGSMDKDMDISFAEGRGHYSATAGQRVGVCSHGGDQRVCFDTTLCTPVPLTLGASISGLAFWV